MIGLFTENGPCDIVELAEGKLGTVAREWGWDRASNVLYIDQVRRDFGNTQLDHFSARGVVERMNLASANS